MKLTQFALVLGCFIFASLVLGLEANEEPESKIVGGVAVPQPIPWYGVMVTRTYIQFCGGNLIAPQWFLTAAHCVVDRGVVTRTNTFWIWLAVQDLQNPNSGIAAYPTEIYVPQIYLDLGIQDVALIKLDRPIDLPSYASLAQQTFPANTPVLVVGFGLTSEQGSPSNILQATDLVVANDEDCAMNGGNIFTEICAGFPSGGRDACQGDSGGPLFINNTLIGIVSRGIGCGRKAPIYGVYSLAGAWRNWVTEVMSGNHTANTTSTSTTTQIPPTSNIATVSTITPPASFSIRTTSSINSNSSSCAGLCGARTLNCSCDERCLENGLCCSDFARQCPATGLIYGCAQGCVNGYCVCNYQNITATASRKASGYSRVRPSVASLRSEATQVAPRQTINPFDGGRTTLARPAWLASLRVNNRTQCTSALIHPRWVLTSAGCLIFRGLKFPIPSLSVSFPAATSVSTSLLTAQVENVFVPSTYLESEFGDIGLVKLKNPVPVTPVNFLEATGGLNDSNIAIATGFNFTMASILQLPIRNTTECGAENFNFDPSSEFCTGFKGLNQPAACLTDQGSPVLDSTLNTLVGICSRGFGCREVDVYSVQTNVTQWRNWIDEVMKANISLPKPGSCQSICGGIGEYENGTLCACDPSCRVSGDCCPDYKQICSNATSDFDVPQTALDGCQCVCNKDYKGMDCSVYMPVASVSSTGSPVLPTETLAPTSSPVGPTLPTMAPTIAPTIAPRPTVSASNGIFSLSPLFFLLLLFIALIAN